MTGIIKPAAHSSLKGSRDGAGEVLFGVAGRSVKRLEGATIDRPYDSDAASSGRPQITTTRI